MATGDLEHLLASDYLGDLQRRPIDEIRSMRAECRRLEDALSYVRRLVQGRLDIVAADLARRADGLDPSDASTLVEHLPEILGHSVQAPGLGRLTISLEPPEEVDDLTLELDRIVDPHTLVALDNLNEDEVRSLVDRLTEFEHNVSAQRRSLQDHVDALQAELVRRYKTGEAKPDRLLS